MSTPAPLPNHLPGWAKRLADLYFAGTSAMFVLHGNTNDLVPLTGGDKPRYGSINEFLATQLFGRFDLVLGFDLAHGIRAYAGGDVERQRQMVGLMSRRIGDPEKLPRDPAQALFLLDRLVLVQPDGQGQRAHPHRDAVRLRLVHRARPGARRRQRATNLVTLLKWAANPYVKRSNLAFVLIDERLADFHDRLATARTSTRSRLTLPDESERLRFLKTITEGVDMPSFSDFSVENLAHADGCSDPGRPRGADRERTAQRRAAGRQALQGAQEAADRAPGAGLAGVHRAQVRPGARGRP
jgi:hypothetical protein